ncbi:hypothetical protein TWF594_011849 [Orbilia oligospora]|nr:hypothetical protein TWF594_011849 [Orbilia oligospora]
MPNYCISSRGPIPEPSQNCPRTLSRITVSGNSSIARMVSCSPGLATSLPNRQWALYFRSKSGSNDWRPSTPRDTNGYFHPVPLLASASKCKLLSPTEENITKCTSIAWHGICTEHGA